MLNINQEQAIHASGNLAVFACPGSGKTRTLIEKAAHLISPDHDDRILIVTFTKKAAGEIKERINKKIGPLSSRISVGTFHSVCKQQLEKGLSKKFNLVTGSKLIALVKRAMKQVDFEGKADDALQKIDAAKCSITAPTDAAINDLFEAYQELLRRDGKHDMHDLILDAVAEMKAGRLRPFGHKWIFVDEFQDTDHVQFEWLKLHRNPSRSITVVGDDDQCIYGWRNALGFQGMERFVNEFQAEVVTLGINYRSYREIVFPSACLINLNQDRMLKALDPARGRGGRIACNRFSTDQDEAEALANAATQAPSEWAVLARTNMALDVIELELTARQIPYTRHGGSGVWSKLATQVLLDLLQSISRQSNGGYDSLLHWMGVPEHELSQLHQHGQISYVGASYPDGDGISASTKKTINNLAIKFLDWQNLAKNKREELLLIGVSEFLMPAASTWDKEILARAISVLQRLKGSISQRIALVQRKQEEDIEGVGLFTMHASKGLEFTNVWIIRAEEEVIPSERSPESEERRLMYVAMTRAQNRLVISATSLNKPSRFISEAGLSMPKVGSPINL
ncbi:superfamily I DNA/RNA helicase [Iodobacter fluviatilis]|uniref:DNA 3'-5' helicase n=2 Tax=Iodobacter fluviatilis TaxID=537 RepID=A0A377Q5V4_9NEIS|nr:superfamily I DNA/RNA helicase [Iodobacter fluviatilis]STQ90100.1 ATP-dependent DNA helicase pcrA [Iodobacter fluviatilis]